MYVILRYRLFKYSNVPLDHLVCDEKDLCQLAFERGSLTKLASLVKSITPSEASPGWDKDEPESVARLREVCCFHGSYMVIQFT